MQQPNYQSFSDALATCDEDLGEAYIGLCDLAQKTIGHKLFTLMTVDRATGEAARVYSNMPVAYPISGKKPANQTPWRSQVIDHHKTFVANDINAIARVFDDYQLIQSLGCESVINVPIIIAGRVIGTVNCLAEAGHYNAERVAASETLKLPGAACFLSQLSSSYLGGH